MTKWEYRVVDPITEEQYSYYATNKEKIIEKIFNSLGLEGWEMCGTYVQNSGYPLYIIFLREQ